MFGEELELVVHVELKALVETVQPLHTLHHPPLVPLHLLLQPGQDPAPSGNKK